MTDVKIYTTSYCGYCRAAKALLDSLSVAYEEVDLTGDWEGRQRLVPLAEGRTTVPQVFIGGRSVGGYDDLVSLHAAGELESMLHADAD
jgi:glutaredoxin 3